jgi:hypothetical protein
MNASELLNRITKAKRSQTRLLAHVLQAEPVLGEKIRWCGGWLHFREWVGSGDTRLINANFCKKHLLCQACAVRRAGKMNEAYAPKIEAVSAEFPQLVPAMITLTVKNGADLEERIKHFKRSWSNMLAAKRKGASASGRHEPIEFNKVLGSLRALEITKGKDKLWHPHGHIFVLLTEYINVKKLSEEWQRFSGDSCIVDVRKCHGGIKAGLLEVLKYACKFSSLTPEETYHVHKVCSGTRLIDPQGILRGVPEPDIDSDDIEGMSGPYRDFIATWLMGQSKYRIEYVTDEPLTIIRPERPAKVPPVVPLPPLPPSKIDARTAEFMARMSNRKPR